MYRKGDGRHIRRHTRDEPIGPSSDAAAPLIHAAGTRDRPVQPIRPVAERLLAVAIPQAVWRILWSFEDSSGTKRPPEIYTWGGRSFRVAGIVSYDDTKPK